MEAVALVAAAAAAATETFGGGVTPPVTRRVLLGLRFISELVVPGEITFEGGDIIVLPGEALIKFKINFQS